MDEEVIVLSDSGSRRSSPSPSRSSGVNDVDIDNLPVVNFHYLSDNNNPLEIISRLDSGFSSQPVPEKHDPKKKKGRKIQEKNQQVQQKKRLVEEKHKKAQREKLLKQVERKNKQSQKPEEAIRNCRAILDESFQTGDHLQAIISTMREHEGTFSIAKNPVPYSILWERTSFLYFLDNDDLIQSNDSVIIENQMVILWSWRDVVEMIAEKTFRTTVEDIHRRCPDKKITLLIDGMEKYFAYQKGKGRKRDYDKKYDCGKAKISKMTLEEELVEIQVLYKISSQLIEDSEQVALTVYQFTKAIALIPFKEEKWKKLNDVDTYVTGEKKDLVAVSKEGYGLKRLWQKQLCQFNLCSLETAEAICSVYSSPVQLMRAYMNCSNSEGEMLLKDIPVRRAAGPLSCVRKIGPELSKKIYLMFTSIDGDNLLGNAK